MMEREVREAYSNTNQGIAVSIAICNLHAMAEGARLTLLYVDNQRHDDLLALLVPILSGVAWNVLTRIGCLDSWLHFISRGVRLLHGLSAFRRYFGVDLGTALHWERLQLGGS
mmetsp:Transcript_76375/g.154950  ORF Transcript_76375/g.154950 Transcript_76375/m.154950 type:complete len:113 (-) Transcript_76375:582-920(-)